MGLFTVRRGIIVSQKLKSGAEQKTYSSAKYINKNYTSPLTL